jgi:hypothetical protein
MGWRQGRQYAGAALGAWLGTAAGCGGPGKAIERPSAALSSSSEAQAELHGIVADWARATRPARIALEPRLHAFRARFPRDDSARIAGALLAWAEVEQGRLDDAVETANGVRAGGAGTASDLALLVQGAAERRRERAAEALHLLEPLESKLIDGYARAFFNEEIVASALGAGRPRRALDLMEIWLREASAEEHAEVMKRIAALLPTVPTADLREELARSASSPDGELRKLVAHRLAAVAVEKRDVPLAQDLLATAGPLLGELGDAVAQLAAGASAARVEERTIGLLLSLRTEEARRRGVEVVAGVAHGLGLPGSAARLVSRDDGGSAAHDEEALAGLGTDGASIVIAGVDPLQAAAAARFAEANRIPVVLLEPPGPSAPRASEFVFVAGEDPDRVDQTLVAALLARGRRPIAVVGSGAGGTEGLALVKDCAQVDAVAWKSLGLAGLVLGGSADCAREALVQTAGLRLFYAADLEAGAMALPAGSVVATAGLFPVDADAVPAVLGLWMTRHPQPPSWWAGVGRDAAVLALAGVERLPKEGTDKPEEVRARRAAAAAGLASAKAELWTTEALGFEGGRVLERALGVREVKGPAAKGEGRRGP